jgi:hypothetical protein
MAITGTWVKYDNVPPFTRGFENLPYLPINLTDNLQIMGLKFQNDEIYTVQIYLWDEVADVYYYDPYSVSYSENLISNGDITIEAARFHDYTVTVVSTEDVFTDFGGKDTINSDNDVLIPLDNGTFTHGVHNFIIGDTILLKDQSNSYENGVYEVLGLGSASTTWTLRRKLNELQLKDLIVLDEQDSTYGLKIDQAIPVIDGSTAITFNTLIETESDLITNLTWTNILARDGGDMVKFVLNKEVVDPLSVQPEENFKISLNSRLEGYSYKLAIKLENSNVLFTKFQVRNIKLIAEVANKEPDTQSRQVIIFSETEVPVIRETMQVERFKPTYTSDNVTYNVVNTTWTTVDTIQVFKQQIGGVRQQVDPATYLAAGNIGVISFLTAQLPTDTITVTISRPLTQEGIL